MVTFRYFCKHAWKSVYNAAVSGCLWMLLEVGVELPCELSVLQLHPCHIPPAQRMPAAFSATVSVCPWPQAAKESASNHSAFSSSSPAHYAPCCGKSSYQEMSASRDHRTEIQSTTVLNAYPPNSGQNLACVLLFISCFPVLIATSMAMTLIRKTSIFYHIPEHRNC